MILPMPELMPLYSNEFDVTYLTEGLNDLGGLCFTMMSQSVAYVSL